MYCIECGRANPEGARFCAYCGVRLFTGEKISPAASVEAAAEIAPAIPAEDAAQAEPAGKNAVQPTDAHAPAAKAEPVPYVRQRKYRTLQPLAANPAQPEREAKPSVQPVAAEPPVQHASVEEEPLPDEMETMPPFGEEELLWNGDVQPVQTPAEESAAQEPVEEEWWNGPDDQPIAPVEPPEDLWADEDAQDEPEKVKKKFAFPWQKNRDDNMVLTASGTEEMPARKPVISRKRRDTRIPERIVRPEEPEQADTDAEEEEDIFFMRPKKPKPVREDDTLDDAYVNGRVRSILFGIAFVACLFAAVWLFATNSGQMFLAGFNLSSDAQAYRDLGDSARANNQIRRAAEAYYKALSLDPDDYETALLVGKTQQQIGENDTAADAYYMCTQLRPAEPEPYEALIRLYEIQDEPEKAEYFRNLGVANTGQADLGAE